MRFFYRSRLPGRVHSKDGRSEKKSFSAETIQSRRRFNFAGSDEGNAPRPSLSNVGRPLRPVQESDHLTRAGVTILLERRIDLAQAMDDAHGVPAALFQAADYDAK